jgi:hypothetical protein
MIKIKVGFFSCLNLIPAKAGARGAWTVACILIKANLIETS